MIGVIVEKNRSGTREGETARKTTRRHPYTNEGEGETAQEDRGENTAVTEETEKGACAAKTEVPRKDKGAAVRHHKGRSEENEKAQVSLCLSSVSLSVFLC